jgi:hypothetical protein
MSTQQEPRPTWELFVEEGERSVGYGIAVTATGIATLVCGIVYNSPDAVKAGALQVGGGIGGIGRGLYLVYRGEGSRDRAEVEQERLRLEAQLNTLVTEQDDEVLESAANQGMNIEKAEENNETLAEMLEDEAKGLLASV